MTKSFKIFWKDDIPLLAKKYKKELTIIKNAKVLSDLKIIKSISISDICLLDSDFIKNLFICLKNADFNDFENTFFNILEKNFVDVIDFLCKLHGASKFFNMALVISINLGYIEMLKVLVKNGATPKNHICLVTAAFLGYTDIYVYLMHISKCKDYDVIKFYNTISSDFFIKLKNQRDEITYYLKQEIEIKAKQIYNLTQKLSSLSTSNK